MSSRATTPGVYFELVPRAQEISPVRTDVGCFVGPTARGPLAVMVRVEGWKSYLAAFGGLQTGHNTPYAVQSYFNNSAEVAWIYRVGGRSDRVAPPATASAPLVVRTPAGTGWTPDSIFRFGSAGYRVLASSPGTWGNGAQVEVRYQRDGLGGAQVEIVVVCEHEPVEYLESISLAPREDGEDPFVAGVNARARLIHVEVAAEGPPAQAPPAGPRYRSWSLTLSGGVDPTSGRADYLDAVTAVMEQPEPALAAFPDLYRQIADREEYLEVLERAVVEADALHDRQVIIDIPPCSQTGGGRGAGSAATWVDEVRQRIAGVERSATVYFPPLVVRDAAGTVNRPMREMPPSGAVAGLIARLDRERSPFHTPANAELFEVVDVTAAFHEHEQAVLHRSGINLVRCAPNRGIVVWGGRTLARVPDSPFLAHRRLIHRLVRSFNRVAEPLVFDVNGPILWQTFARALTGVLLRAWRSGALKGERPEQAFRVKCNAETNPPESVDLGRVVCEVEVAIAAPMEFITLRVAVSAEGALEVFES